MISSLPTFYGSTRTRHMTMDPLSPWAIPHVLENSYSLLKFDAIYTWCCQQHLLATS
jgi:hypothetical protein